jgi:UDP-N-acetylglucosamine 2-epimerase
LPGIQFVITSANADINGEEANSIFRQASKVYPNLFFTESLGQTRYLSLLKLAKVVVGNSSSGLLEAPSLGTATVNIGARQTGRPRAKSVIDVECIDQEIRDAILTSLSIDFQITLTHIENPYGTPGASSRIKEILSRIDYPSLLPKAFYDSEIGATYAPK